jgi:hypothetical protein
MGRPSSVRIRALQGTRGVVCGVYLTPSDAARSRASRAHGSLTAAERQSLFLILTDF